MKRSKIFLGLTTCILAVAAFATKNAKFNHQEAVYTLSQNNKCTSSLNKLGNTQSVSPQAGWSYNNVIGGGCVTPLFQPE